GIRDLIVTGVQTCALAIFNREKLGTVTETHFEGPRREELYTPPLVLIRENESLPVAFWNHGFLAYRDKIVGVHSGLSDAAALRRSEERRVGKEWRHRGAPV